MKKIHNPAVAEAFEKYPLDMRKKLLFLRQLILETAAEINVGELEETLKWGEPSYIARQGSTIRMDWKARDPEHYALHFIAKPGSLKRLKYFMGICFVIKAIGQSFLPATNSYRSGS